VDNSQLSDGVEIPGARTTGPERVIRELLSEAGIEVNGSRAFDIQVTDPRFYRRVLGEGSIGFGESYMDRWWDCDDMVELLSRIAAHDVEKKLKTSARFLWEVFKARVFNLQSRARAPMVGREHYDQTLQAYRNMTDRWITLSCGYWKDATTLDEAQEAKLDLMCRKIGLDAGQRVLDIGCGFGSFARFAASRYGASVVGINISPRQAEEAARECRGLPVNVVNCDYRDTGRYLAQGPFDKVVSAGMFEHVGYKNFAAYFRAAHSALKDGGLFLLQTCGMNESRVHNDMWHEKYIFPNSLIPSIKQISAATENLLVMEDWHNFGHDYSLTLRAWYENFDRTWSGSKDDTFYRMWKFYLLSCAGWFQARSNQLWQIVFCKGGVAGGYQSIR